MLKTFLASGTALAALCTITTPALAQAAADALCLTSDAVNNGSKKCWATASGAIAANAPAHSAAESATASWLPCTAVNRRWTRRSATLLIRSDGAWATTSRNAISRRYSRGHGSSSKASSSPSSSCGAPATQLPRAAAAAVFASSASPTSPRAVSASSCR